MVAVLFGTNVTPLQPAGTGMARLVELNGTIVSADIELNGRENGPWICEPLGRLVCVPWIDNAPLDIL